jgi:hypothetical protein
MNDFSLNDVNDYIETYQKSCKEEHGVCYTTGRRIPHGWDMQMIMSICEEKFGKGAGNYAKTFIMQQCNIK